MATQEELRAVTIGIVAELQKLEIMEPESDKTLARVFELLPLVETDRLKQAMLLKRITEEREVDILRWLLKRAKPNLAQRKNLIAGLRKLFEDRRLS